jgi:hypothetical protein
VATPAARLAGKKCRWLARQSPATSIAMVCDSCRRLDVFSSVARLSPEPSRFRAVATASWRWRPHHPVERSATSPPS